MKIEGYEIPDATLATRARAEVMFTCRWQVRTIEAHGAEIGDDALSDRAQRVADRMISKFRAAKELRLKGAGASAVWSWRA